MYLWCAGCLLVLNSLLQMAQYKGVRRYFPLQAFCERLMDSAIVYDTDTGALFMDCHKPAVAAPLLQILMLCLLFTLFLE